MRLHFKKWRGIFSNGRDGSSSINGVFKPVLNFLFIYNKISQAPKSTTNLRFIDIKFIDIRFVEFDISLSSKN